MTSLDHDEAELHLWAEFNLPVELRDPGAHRPTPLGQSVVRGRRLAVIAAAAEAHRESRVDATLPPGRLGLA